MIKGQRLGYVRISTTGQKDDRQHVTMGGLNLDYVFEDKQTGRNRDRPGLRDLMKHARKGDTVFVAEMSRLGRNLSELLAIIGELREGGVDVHFVKENLTADDSATSQAMIGFFAVIAQFETDLMHERQAEGIAIAKAAGKYKGRAASLTDEQADELRARLAAGEGATALAREYRISRASVYNYKKSA